MLGGGGGLLDRWKLALKKRAAQRRVRLCERARGAVAGGGGVSDRCWGGGGG